LLPAQQEAITLWTADFKTPAGSSGFFSMADLAEIKNNKICMQAFRSLPPIQYY
jgi:hypothetical protein